MIKEKVSKAKSLFTFFIDSSVYLNNLFHSLQFVFFKKLCFEQLFII